MYSLYAAVLISGFKGLNGRTEAFGTHYADLFIWKIYPSPFIMFTDSFSGSDSISLLSLESSVTEEYHESDESVLHAYGSDTESFKVIKQLLQKLKTQGRYIHELKALHAVELAGKDEFITRLQAEKKAEVSEKALSLSEFLNTVHEAELAKKEIHLIAKMKAMHQKEFFEKASSIIMLEAALAKRNSTISNYQYVLATIHSKCQRVQPIVSHIRHIIDNPPPKIPFGRLTHFNAAMSRALYIQRVRGALDQLESSFDFLCRDVMTTSILR